MDCIRYPTFITVFKGSGINVSSTYELIQNMAAKIDADSIYVYDNGKVYFSVDFKNAAEYLSNATSRGYTFAYDYVLNHGRNQYVPLKWCILRYDDNKSKYDVDNLFVIFYEEGTYDVEFPEAIKQDSW